MQSTRWEILRVLAGRPVERLVIVAPHPDDEVIGASSFLPLLRERAFVIYVTQGAPGFGQNDRKVLATTLAGSKSGALKKRISSAKSIIDPKHNAMIRRQEAKEVLSFCEIPLHNAFWLNFSDQRVSYELDRFVAELGRVLSHIKPDAILTPPYEGGHPDHDSAALGVASVCAQTGACRRVEMLSYHNRNGRLEFGRFLASAGPTREHHIILSEEERSRKAAMFSIYASQREVLRNFPINEERFRIAPDYNFLEPPHSGPLYYDFFHWGIDGSHWRERARSFLGR